MRRWVPALLACTWLQAGTVLAADPPPPSPPGVASCTGCHAVSRSVETSVPRLYGRKAEELLASMREFKAGSRAHTTVMGRIVKGFSDEEVEAIALWFAAQKDLP